MNASLYLDANGVSGIEPVGSAEAPVSLKIKGRGNYTWTGFDKKPYRLKFDKKVSIMGMKKNKHFGLLAHADDDLGFLRNAVGFELSRRLGLAWTPTAEPVEVFLNGDYIGLYFLTELVRVDPDRVMSSNKRTTPPMPKLSPEEQTIVDALSGGQRLVDDVIAETGLSTGKLLSSLTMLELKGIIRRLPGKRIVLSGT